MIEDTHRQEAVLREWGIPSWVPFRAPNAIHNWRLWHKQIGYFFGKRL